MQTVVLTDDAMQFARMTCEASIVVLIVSESVKNTYLKHLIPVLILEQLLIFLGTVLNYMDVFTEHQFIILRISEIIRIVISLSLCYPISVFLKDVEPKAKSASIYVGCLMIIGITSDLLQYNYIRPGVNYVAFLVISVFTFHQYNQIRRRIEDESSRLTSLIILEVILIILNLLLILLFFKDTGEIKVFVTIEIVMRFIQLHKFYTMILIITQLNPSNTDFKTHDAFVFHISSDFVTENCRLLSK